MRKQYVRHLSLHRDADDDTRLMVKFCTDDVGNLRSGKSLWESARA